MLTIEQIIEALKDRSLKKVSESTGLSYDTVWRVANGKALKPSHDTVKKISDYLKSRAIEVKAD